MANGILFVLLAINQFYYLWSFIFPYVPIPSIQPNWPIVQMKPWPKHWPPKGKNGREGNKRGGGQFYRLIRFLRRQKAEKMRKEWKLESEEKMHWEGWRGEIAKQTAGTPHFLLDNKQENRRWRGY